MQLLKLRKQNEFKKVESNLNQNQKSISDLINSIGAENGDDFLKKYEENNKVKVLQKERKSAILTIEQIVGKDTTTSETKTRTVYPDIIVHKRGPDGPNLLVIEAKKDAMPKEQKTDEKKLMKIKQKYNYTFAVFLNFKTGEVGGVEIEFVE